MLYLPASRNVRDLGVLGRDQRRRSRYFERAWFSRKSLMETTGNIVAGLGFGFVLGRLTRTKLLHSADSGRWACLLPTVLFAPALVSSALHPNLRHDLAELFFPPEGEDLWAVVFFSYPTLGCTGYSLGIWFQSRRTRTAVSRQD